MIVKVNDILPFDLLNILLFSSHRLAEPTLAKDMTEESNQDVIVLSFCLDGSVRQA